MNTVNQPKAKKILLFDYLDNILVKKSDTIYNEHVSSPDFKSTFSRFMILRYLSMAKPQNIRKLVLSCQYILEQFPSDTNTGDRLLYKFLLQHIPRQTSSFIKYIK